VRDLLAADVVWHIPGDNPLAGTYVGIADVIAYFVRLRELASRTFRAHPGEVLVGDGDHVAVLTDGSAHLGGVDRRWSTVGLYRFRGDLIAWYWLLPLDAREFDAVWRSAVSAQTP
jgi:ketosteroid isomerase-like protein